MSIDLGLDVNLEWIHKERAREKDYGVGVDEGCFTLIVAASLYVNPKWVN